MCSDTPDFRATIRRDGSIRLVDWGPWLATGVPLYVMLEARGRAGVAIADLSVVRDDDGLACEAIADFRCGDTPAHRATLVAWAASAGYTRAWFANEIAELEPAAGGRAQTRCSGCRTRLADNSRAFWELVRHRGAFPTACVLCGSDLPQWTLECQTTAPDSDRDAANLEEVAMQVNARADVDVVAVEHGDQVTVMLELSAPVTKKTSNRPAATVQVVLDRSGSMSGERLDAAKDALVRLVDRLDPPDSFGVVAFDDEVQVVVPAAGLADKPAAQHAIANLGPGGMTNLSGGLLRGMQEARRVAGAGGATLLVLSDGHANTGETDPQRLAGVASTARWHGITTTTVGIGRDYDELLLAEVARGGQGSHVFAEQGDAAAAAVAVAGEVEGLLTKTVQAASLIIRPDAAVDSVRVWNDLPATSIQGGIMAKLGDLWSGEQRKLVITIAVPTKPALGLAQIAELEVRYVAVPSLAEQTVTVPVHVNVVPGDQAAGRIPDPQVRTELVYQQVQDAKRKAADALRDGDHHGARAAYDAARAQLDEIIVECPSPELSDEREIVDRLARRLREGDAGWAAKFSRMDQAHKSRKRGRGDLGV